MNKLTGKPYRSFGGICSYTNDFARRAETCQALWRAKNAVAG
jgi:hypothetical protein